MRIVGCEVRNGEIGCSFPQRDEPVEFEDVVVVGENRVCWHMIFESDVDTWIPKSQLLEGSDELEVGGSGTVIVPRWLAEDRGLA